MNDRIKRMLSGIMLMILLIIPCQTAQAMDNITLPAMKDAATVTFRGDVPEGFSRDIEIWLNGSPYYMTAQSGYVTKIDLEPGNYEIKVILTDDILNQYQAEHIDSFDPRETKDITIGIVYSPEAEPENEGEEHVLFDIENTDDVMEPQVFDFSDGKEYGTLLISREQYGAVKTATYRLVGNDSVYDIPLDRDYIGQAKVLLPVGSYYESGTIEVELAPDASIPDHAQFLWQHKENLGNWGNYYTVSAGETTSIDDLIIMISSDGDVFEVDSSLLFSKTYMKNYESLAESHRQEALESVFPEKYETKESETIATVIPVEEPETPLLLEIAILLAAVVILILFIWAMIKFRNAKERKKDDSSKR